MNGAGCPLCILYQYHRAHVAEARGDIRPTHLQGPLTLPKLYCGPCLKWKVPAEPTKLDEDFYSKFFLRARPAFVALHAENFINPNYIYQIYGVDPDTVEHTKEGLLSIQRKRGVLHFKHFSEEQRCKCANCG